MNREIIFELVKEFINKQDYANALKFLHKLCKNKSALSDFDIVFHLGKVYFYLKKYTFAYKYLLISLKSSDINIQYYSRYYISSIYRYSNEFNKSIKILKEINIEKIKNKDLLSDILYSFAVLYFENKDYINSIKYFSKLIVKSDKINLINCSKYYLFLINLKMNKIIKSLNILLNNYNSIKNCDIDFRENLKELIFLLKLKLEKIIDSKILIKYFKYYLKYKNKNIDIYEDLLKCIYESIIYLCQRYNLVGNYANTIKIYKTYNNLLQTNSGDLFLNNKFLNEYELASKKIILKSKPRSIAITLTNICDLKCIMCFQTKDKIANINKKILDIILNNLVYLERIIWQGGEVFILPYFKELLLKVANYPKIRQVIISNFQNISEDILKLLVNLNVCLTISIDAPTKQLYEHIRVGADFNRLIKNITLLNKYMTNCKNKYFTKKINFVMMKINYKMIPVMLQFAYKYDFHEIDFGIYEGNNKNFCLSYDDIKSIIKNIPKYKKIAKKYDIDFSIQIPHDINCMKSTRVLTKDYINDNKSEYQFKQFQDLTKSNSENYKCLSEKVCKSNVKYGNFFNLKNIKLFSIIKNSTVFYAGRHVTFPAKVSNCSLFCHLPWQELTIIMDDYLQSNCLCNLKQQFKDENIDGIYDIWNHSILKNIRKNIKNKQIIKTCSSKCIALGAQKHKLLEF